MKNRCLLVSPFFPPPFIGGGKVWTYNMVENSPEKFDVLTSRLQDGCKEVLSPRHEIFRSHYIWDETNVKDPSLKNLLVSILWEQ